MDWARVDTMQLGQIGAKRRTVLLTVSGSVPADLDEQVASGRRPRADYRVLAERMGADVVDVEMARAELGRFGRVIGRLGAGPLLGWYAFRHRGSYDVILTDGEQVGIPFALLTRVMGRRGSKHVMIAHILSVPKKATLIRWLRLAPLIDRFIVYCTWQAEFVRDEFGVPVDRIVTSTFMVDADFFDPATIDVERSRMICAAGLERRDYPTLLQAVDGLDVEVVIAAASPWSKQADSSERQVIPTNVTIERLDLFALRDLYAASAFVVMPLVEVEFQAGVTTILEAMAMGKAVVCSRTSGQTDVIVEGETGRYVIPGDPAELRRVIEDLLADEATAERLGANGRRWVLEHAALDRYADEIAAVVAGVAPGVIAGAGAGPVPGVVAATATDADSTAEVAGRVDSVATTTTTDDNR